MVSCHREIQWRGKCRIWRLWTSLTLGMELQCISRIIVTKVLKLVLLMVFRMKVADANTPFRLMKREVLMEYLPDVPVDYNLTNVLLSVLFLYNDVSVEYLPISFRKRRGGTNSINVLKIIGIGLKSLKDFYVIKKNMKKHACICNR